MIEFGTRVVRTARSFAERCGAWGIVYRRYVESEFISPNPSGLYFSLLDLLPSSECWLALSEGRIVGTMSSVFYSTAGLPSGTQYEFDLKNHGVDGRLFCEFTKFAIEKAGGSQAAALEIMGAMIASAWKSGVDDVICVVHPDHARVWTQVYGFQVLGETKKHKGVNGNLGVLLGIDMKQTGAPFAGASRKGCSILERCLEELIGHEKTHRPSGSEAVALLLQRPELLLNSPPHHRAAFEKYYPWAIRLLGRLLHASLNGWSNVVQFPATPPQRERRFVYANGSSHWRANTLQSDRLFDPDAPLVLVVEERAPFRKIFMQILEEANFIPVTASSLADAKELARKNTFDLVLLASCHSECELSEITDTIRESDAHFHVHTLIVEISSIILSAAPRLLDTPSQEQLLSEMSCLRELAQTLKSITAWHRHDSAGHELVEQVSELQYAKTGSTDT